jgi:hypothetical protein
VPAPVTSTRFPCMRPFELIFDPPNFPGVNSRWQHTTEYDRLQGGAMLPEGHLPMTYNR